VPHYGLLEQTSWVWELSMAGLDLLHVPHFNVPLSYRGRFVVTIHDLLWHAQRDPGATTLSPLWHRLKYRGYRLVSESAIKRAAAVLVPSRVVQQEIERITGRKDQVAVTYEGIPDAYRGVDSVSAPREKFIVYTGSLYPHKNLEVVLRSLIDSPDLRLMVASTRSVFTDRMKRRARALGVERQVEWLGFVPDEELIGLYRRARALVQPSKSEGFGLTGLEAMADGCPVVASDIPIFREIYGGHAVFFNPDDPQALAGRLAAPVPDKDQLAAAKKHAESFSWQRMAEETLAVYNSVLTRPIRS
jgi:glycosyltransferase involved in cell wall biosynthesis